MKFLADENFPRPAIMILRQNGFQVVSIAETKPGAPDEDVLALAGSESCILLTLDKDFGELVFQRGLKSDPGVILFRIETRSPEDFAAVVLDVLRTAPDWAGAFTVVNNDRIRTIKLPSRS
ncbi:MAG TPA: DUF5615 family PIN-like protein [Bryobacteraceae bacterium]|nr:DUF5615 family PIN-like protein [Bryobacteraceae bacterium]